MVDKSKQQLTFCYLAPLTLVVMQDRSCTWNRLQSRTGQSSSMPWVTAASLVTSTRTKSTKRSKYVFSAVFDHTDDVFMLQQSAKLLIPVCCLLTT